MSPNATEYLAPSPEAIADYKRAAMIERAVALDTGFRSIAAWLRRGIALRYHDDAVTHPAAGPTCGC